MARGCLLSLIALSLALRDAVEASPSLPSDRTLGWHTDLPSPVRGRLLLKKKEQTAADAPQITSQLLHPNYVGNAGLDRRKSAKRRAAESGKGWRLMVGHYQPTSVSEQTCWQNDTDVVAIQAAQNLSVVLTSASQRRLLRQPAPAGDVPLLRPLLNASILGYREVAARDNAELGVKAGGKPGAARAGEIIKAMWNYPRLAMPQGAGALHPPLLRGNSRRLHSFLQKLLEGQPVKVTVIGASVSGGMGSIRGDEGCRSLHEHFMQWLLRTFPAKPPGHTFENRSRNGTNAQYHTACGVRTGPSDLVLIELTLNAHGSKRLTAFRRRPFWEQLLRQQLIQSPDVAIVAVHWWTANINKDIWYNSAEADHEAVNAYYGVPSLSWRNSATRALFHIPRLPGWTPEELQWDSAHPSCLGHRLLADQMIAMMQEQMMEKLQAPIVHEPHSPSAGRVILKPPMLRGNDYTDDLKGACVTDEAFREQAQPPHTDWEFVDEGSGGQKKLGFVSTTPGSSITIQVNDGACLANNMSSFLVGILHLKSYENMGMFMLSCGGGCACAKTRVSGVGTGRTSQEFYHWVEIVRNLSASAKPCLVTAKVLQETESGQHKVKVSGSTVRCINAKRLGKRAMNKMNG